MYACEYARGTTTKCGPETIARLEQAIEYVRQHPKEKITILLTAGCAPRKICRSSPLKVIMAEYALKRCREEMVADGTFNLPTINSAIEENRWGTLQETIGMTTLIGDDAPARIIAISSWYHLRRIRFLWKKLTGVAIETLSVQKTTNRLLPWLELLKIPKAWLQVHLYLWKSIAQSTAAPY